MKSVSLFAMDVDGVLTDGTLEYGPGGACQRFDAHDGAGLIALQKTGMPLALISFRDLESTRRRARDLGIRYLLLGRSDKRKALDDLCTHLGTEPASALYMGDDEMDIPALEAAGVSACPSNARPSVKSVCQIVTSRPGGSGAVREVVDMLLDGRLR